MSIQEQATNGVKKHVISACIIVVALLLVWWLAQQSRQVADDNTLREFVSDVPVEAEELATSSPEVATSTSEGAEVTVVSQPEVVAPTVPVVPTPPAPSQPEVPVEPEESVVPVVSSDGVTSAHVSTILQGHNGKRTSVGAPALSWSSNLANSAQSWADTLAARGCNWSHSNTPHGENIYYSWTTSNDRSLKPAEAVFWWLDEEQYYDYGSNTCESGEVCGHYTQAVWAETTQVGCGVSTCTEGDKFTQMWVCQYNPAGNWAGEKPY